MESRLERFLTAQQRDYPQALEEIKAGRKRSHWMWYIFPQLAGLGRSDTAKFYGIKDLNEAAAFLHHPVLGTNLVEISTALTQLESSQATPIFGSPDDMKLRSCMTLFSLLPDASPVFEKVLRKFYGGQKDEQTLNLIQGPRKD